MAESDRDLKDLEQQVVWRFLTSLGWKGLAGIVILVFGLGQIYLSYKDWKVLLSDDNIAEYALRGGAIKTNTSDIEEIKENLKNLEAIVKENNAVLHRRISKIKDGSP